MTGKLVEFYQLSLSNFLEGIFNYFIFLPYFFSVTNLLKTLFSPWKNLYIVKTETGFNLQKIINRLSFNLVSRTIGFFMRLAILTFYLLVQILYVVVLPLVITVYLILIPLLFIFSLSQKKQSEKKASSLEVFVAQHLIEEKNRQAVINWFSNFYNQKFLQSQWWKLENLFIIPPLARDWAMGYTPTLNEYCQDLTAINYQKELINTVLRQEEIEQIERVLTRSESANVIIVGEAGVGKHTLIDNLAKRIYLGSTNPLLIYKRVLKLNLERILNKYTDEKQRESFFEELLEEAEAAGNIILLINNFEKYINLFNSLEKFAASPKLHTIGITTPFAYQKFIFNDEGINRYFTKIDVTEVNQKTAEKILLNKVLSFENKYQVVIPYETVITTIEKSNYYITNIPFPEKAIVILDSACSYVKATLHQPIVLPESIDKVITQMTHISTILTPETKTKLNQIEEVLTTQIIGQDRAISNITATLKRAFITLGKRKKPIAAFLFVGPTGVGKTQTAKIIAECFFGKDRELIRFDMSNYQNKKDIGNLIGSLDSSNPGLLSQAIRENPFSVLLLDEIEKADRDILNIFLSLLDEGYFIDGFGKRVDGKNLIIIATSNATSSFQFQQNNLSENELINYLVQNNYFSPEFLNRFDGIIFYQKINSEVTKKIIEKLLVEIAQEIEHNHQIKIKYSPEFINSMQLKNYSDQFGARNLDRLIREEIGNKVANLILENKAHSGDTITV